MRMKLITAILASLLLVSCTVKQYEAAPTTERGVSAPTPTTTLPPAPPTTRYVAPTTRYVPPVDLCDDIDVTNVSSLIPENWDEWCRSIRNSQELFGSYPDPGVCATFWSLNDNDLLWWAVSSTGMSQSAGVGFIDYLWTYC